MQHQHVDRGAAARVMIGRRPFDPAHQARCLYCTDFAVSAFQREFRAFLMLLDQRLIQAQGVADDFRIRGGFAAVFEFLQAFHGLGRHFQLHPGGGALAGLDVFAVRTAAVMMMSTHSSGPRDEVRRDPASDGGRPSMRTAWRGLRDGHVRILPVFFVLIVVVAAMMMTVPAMAAAAVPFRLAFIQREILAHTDIEFAHT